MSPFVNAHTHLYSGLVPLGMPQPTPSPQNFTQILERVWWRLDRALDADSLRAAARLYVLEALDAGTHCLVDHHESPEFIEGSLDILADACEELGMHALLCYGATERNGGALEALRGLAECRRFLETQPRSGIRGLVGVHAGFTVSDETLVAAGNLAREFETVLHLHVAEDAYDVEDARRRGYRGVIHRLRELDALVPGSILAHGVHLDEAEVRACFDARCWLVQNPRSNTANGVGYPRALRASERVALGSDGFPSDMRVEEQALLASAHDAGDDLEAAGRRLASGEDLARAWFSEAAQPASVSDELRRDIRAQALEEATRLWSRMASS